jgi:Tol biopolymer transport system component
MALAIGTQLGAYEIAESIGAGGMGEVYRAHDPVLGRDVAIKVLPASFTNDANRVARFEQEAKTLAALNHANIAHIYGLERSDVATALVMELVEGPTLAERIAQGPLPPDEALGVALQIADALEAAHVRGIVHRDLKPANIKLTPEGIVKLLDFGIAKALDTQRGASGSQSPALTTPAMTEAGVLLGTAAYMAPEQARGKLVDQRADLWAFGCVLYEMLTGQPAFGGDDVSVTLARVLEREVDLRRLPATVSPGIEQAIRLCLEKDLKRRFADIRDVRLALQGALAPSLAASRAPAPRRALWRRAVPVVAAAVVAAALAAAGMRLATRPVPATPIHLTLAHPPPERWATNAFGVNIAISPDGRNVAYTAGEPSAPQAALRLYVRALDQADPVLLTDRARMPFFSPDGRWVGFVQANERLSKVPLAGGASVPIGGNARAPRGATWGPDDTIVFANYQDGTGLLRIAASGGEPQTLTTPDAGKGEIGHRFPQFLPGGKAVLFTIVSRDGAGRSTDNVVYTIAVLDLATGQYRALLPGSYARYSPSGHLVYATNGKLNAVAFDLKRLAIAGAPQTVLSEVMTDEQGSGAVPFDVSDTGTLIFERGTAATPRVALEWLDRAGMEQPLGTGPDLLNRARGAVSPDGDTVALPVATRDGGASLALWSVSRRILTRLTSGQQSIDYPLWTPDGRRIVYLAFNRGLFWRLADGTGTEEQLLEAGADVVVPNGWTVDGQLVFSRYAGTSTHLFVLAPNGDRTPKPLLPSSSFREGAAAVSPDGRWVAYQSDESGTTEVYVRPLPDTGSGRWQISSAGGVGAKWSPSGRELLFAAAGELMAVSVDATPTFRPGVPRKVVTMPNGMNFFDVAPDGRRFLVAKRVAEAEDAAPQLDVVLNWSQQLSRLVRAE